MHAPDPEPRHLLRRRRLLGAVGVLAAGTAGCISGPETADSRQTAPDTTDSDTTDSDTTDSDGTATQTTDDRTPSGDIPTVVDLSVADYIHYALAGVHPHVHRAPDTQYVLVRLETTASDDTVRQQLRLELDGTPMALAERRLLDWETETVDVAFAVPKGSLFDTGRVLFGSASATDERQELHSVSDETLDRLNEPPVFSVSDLSLSVSEVQEGEQVEATVRFSLENTGSGAGTFGASLKANYVSGSHTVTETLAAGAEQEVTGTVTLVGTSDHATVRLDWGSDEWTRDVPVVEGDTSSETTTATSST